MNTATETTFRVVARELADAFESRIRSNGEQFDALRDDAPGWIHTQTCRSAPIMDAHAAIGRDLPNDWAYRACRRAADVIALTDDEESAREQIAATSETIQDPWYGDLFSWAAHPAHQSIADEAAEDDAETEGPRGRFTGRVDPGAFSARVIRWAQRGQALAFLRIGEALIDAVRIEAERRGAAAAD